MEISNERVVLDAVQALGALDDVIHQKVRLGILATLLTLGNADFRLLKETLSLSDGNLSTHVTLLENAGYVVSHKEFVLKKPHTTYTPTEAGRLAFHNYLKALEQVVKLGAEEALQSHIVPSSGWKLQPQTT